MLKKWKISAALTMITLLLTATAHTGPLSMIKKDSGPAFTPGDKWEAFIQDDKGKLRTLAQPVEQNPDKDWMFLQFTDYQGPRQRLAVMWVENKAPNNWGVEVPISAIEDLLTSALFNTNRFDIVERKNLQTLQAEQNLGATGVVTPQTAAKIGKALGASYLIFTSVNEWVADRGSSGANTSGPLGKFGVNVGVGKTEAEVAMSFRIVDATTGQLLFAETERARAGSWGLNLGGSGGGTGAGGKMGSNTPISYAVQSCINKVGYRIAMSLKDSPWRGSVADVTGSRVYINAGSTDGMQVGMKLTAMTKGKTLEDPETGLPLGEDLSAIGSLQITAVQDQFSVATILQGCKGLKKGDRVELSQEI